MKQLIDIQVKTTYLQIDECYDFVTDPSCGGLALFVGTVRNKNKGESITKLTFEAYTAMALKEMKKIAETCINEKGANKISLHHRIGDVLISEKAVIIAVSSTHRAAAFEACQYAIDTLKETVPIWKKEFLVDGSYWVNATP